MLRRLSPSRTRTRRLLHRQAGNRLEDAVDLLDLVDDQRADRVDVGRFAYGDHVVLAGDGVRGRDATHAFHLLGHLQGAPRRRVDQDIDLHPLTPFLLGGRNCLSLLASAGLGFVFFFPVRLSARCWASFFNPGLTDTTFGPRTFLSRALTCAPSRGETCSSSSLTGG